MYTMTLADGTTVRFSGLNGTNYIVPGQTALDTDIFTDENLVSGTVTDGDGNTEAFANWAFIQQQRQMNGDYYICFRQKTDAELEAEAQAEETVSMQEALVELYEMILGG